MKYISFCSGVEAASLAWIPLGWEAVAFSEIEPFPCAVLKERFPNVPNLGDCTKIHYDKETEELYVREDNGNITNRFHAGKIDLAVGGFPCQSFSVAGKREGLEGASGLVLEYFRLLREIRPDWVVYENVPGMLSSNHGRDFRRLIMEFTKCGYGIAWRVLDAQYVRVDGFPRAVPQRRRRVFVVGYFGSWEYPAQVLFEPASVFRNTPPRRIKGKGFTGNIEDRSGTTGCRIDGFNTMRQCETGGTIRVSGGDVGNKIVSLIPYGTRLGAHENGIASTITRIDAKFPQCVCTESGRPWDSSGVNPTLNQENAGSGIIGASNQELFSQNANGLVMDAKGIDTRNENITGDISMTVTCSATDYHHVPCVMDVNSPNGGDVSGTICSNFAHTATREGGQGACYDIDRRRCLECEGVAPTMVSKMGTGGNNVPVVIGEEK